MYVLGGVSLVVCRELGMSNLLFNLVVGPIFVLVRFLLTQGSMAVSLYFWVARVFLFLWQVGS